MYKKYKSHFTPSVCHKYPSYGKGSSNKGGGGKANYENKGANINVSFDGGKKKKPRYWDRFREMLYEWKKKAGKRTPSPPPRVETPRLPTIPEVPKDEWVKMLKVKDVNLHIEANTKKHRTDEYACTEDREVKGKPLDAELVVRRGDAVKITITFNRPYVKETDHVKLRFTLGPNPKPSRGTMIHFDIDESGLQKFRPDEWGANLQGTNGKDVTLLVQVPANCIIGEWKLDIKTFSEGKNKDGEDCTLIRQYEVDGEITILFNPWCKEDSVYMHCERELDEYVLNESGAVWRGNGKQIGAKPWNFGQFGEEILEICLHLVRSGFETDMLKAMSDPVQVSRMVAKMVNSQDDNGVLSGNWSGDYSGGKSPSVWAGSTKILKQWRTSGPVNYGQCWVFSCVTTTVCRALGIPCRTVTNFSSAHDTDGTCCIETFYRREGDEEEEAKGYTGDSVWNFHVWNEVWMARPDLLPDFPYGWQVIDATPQEESEGYFTCGPCPVAAIRKGILDVNYDTAFVFAEVNADRVHWRVHPSGMLERIRLITDAVGQMISTKTPSGEPFAYEDGMNKWDKKDYSQRNRLDVTDNYKPKEGSAEEREAVMNAHRTAPFPIEGTYKQKEEEKIKPVQFCLTFDADKEIGQSMAVQVKAKNIGKHERKIPHLVIAAYPKEYTGEYSAIFHRKFFSGAMMRPGDETTFDTVLEPQEYIGKLKGQFHIKIVATAYVQPVADEEEQMVREEEEARFMLPDLEIAGPKKAKAGDKVDFLVKFTNPLQDRPLTCCSFSMDSPSFEDSDDITIGDIAGGAQGSATFSVKAGKKGKPKATVTFSFECTELSDVSGAKRIKIDR